MDKKEVRYTHTHTLEYYSATRKKEILPLVKTRVELKGIMLSEIRQRKTNMYNIDITYMWNLKKLNS